MAESSSEATRAHFSDFFVISFLCTKRIKTCLFPRVNLTYASVNNAVGPQMDWRSRICMAPHVNAHNHRNDDGTDNDSNSDKSDTEAQQGKSNVKKQKSSLHDKMRSAPSHLRWC